MEDNEDYSHQFIIEFENMDKDRDQLISFRELMDLMKKCKCPCSESELQDYVNDVNINENGQIDKRAFLHIIRNYQQNKDTKEELDACFKIFDANNKNFLTPQDIGNIFREIDKDIKDEEILQIFKECDLDNDGYLNYDEFCRMVKNK